MGKHKYRNGFAPTLHPDELDAPKRRKKPTRIFVGSMGDLWGKWVPDTFLVDALQVMDACPQHTFMCLTKNPERYHAFSPFPRNVWVGASATDQASWDRACAVLQLVEAPVRFVSVEPMLGRITPTGWIPDWVIIGAQTGPGAVAPPVGAAQLFSAVAVARFVPVFHKDNLPLPSHWRRRRQFPEVAA